MKAVTIPGPTFNEACDMMDGTLDGALDYFAERIADLVVMLDDDATITEATFWPAFCRTYDAALAGFLARVEKHDPQLAVRLRARIGEAEFRDGAPVR